MKDFLGNELYEGDEIIACVGHARNAGASLVKGRIVGFTDKFVKTRIPTYNGYDPGEDTRISPSKIIRMPL
jgi:hypothetical protein